LQTETNTGVIEPGSIALFYSPRGKDWFISFFTKSPYYHAAIMLDKDELVEAIPSGVVRTPLAKKRNKHFRVIAPPSKEIGLAVVRWAKSKIGDGYDPADLLAIALDRVFAHLHIYVAAKDRFTCGEFVAQAYKEVGVVLIPDVKVEEIVPADFARLLPA
jgi:uncharacterized protein YycO